jgi:D-alanine-D-alanine ligase
MTQKIHVGILFGGRSAEHEVSIQSARNVYEAIDKDKYAVSLIGIDKQGRWYLNDASRFLLEAQNPRLLRLNEGNQAIALIPGDTGQELVRTADMSPLPALDVVFPVMHGTYGEDGAIQGLLKMADIPFVGSGILGSAAGMDKDLMKRLLREADIPTPRHLAFGLHQHDQISAEAVADQLGGYPLFVKPANLGSSVGIHKIRNGAEFAPAIADAFRYDRKIIIEKGINCREIECAVLGNEQPLASVPGEVIVNAEFYDYHAKYIDDTGATLSIPAQLTPEQAMQVQSLAIHTFQVLNCEGLARVDFFLDDSGELLVNEVNTLPGFTRISMYPKLWEASGVGYTELIDRLLQLALARNTVEKSLKTTFDF